MSATFKNLLQKGRLNAVVAPNHAGDLCIVKYTRKNGGKGKKSSQEFILKDPQVLAKSGDWHTDERGNKVIDKHQTMSTPAELKEIAQLTHGIDMAKTADMLKQWGDL
jgi:hypothetical protein